MAKVIYDLGVETSTRYAQDKELYDETLIKEGRSIASQTKIISTLPSYLSEFDTLLDLGPKRATWALFAPPPQFSSSRRRLFSEQVVPTLGTPDRQDAQKERLLAFSEEKEKGEIPPANKEEVENEKNILVKVFENLHNLDQQLIDMNARRLQYTKP